MGGRCAGAVVKVVRHQPSAPRSGAGMLQGGGAAALTATGKTSTAPKRVRRLCGSPRGFSAASAVSTESPERPRRPPPATTSYLLGKSVGSRQSGYWPQPRPHLQAAS